jgi:hypothetical protein
MTATSEVLTVKSPQYIGSTLFSALDTLMLRVVNQGRKPTLIEHVSSGVSVLVNSVVSTRDSDAQAISHSIYWWGQGPGQGLDTPQPLPHGLDPLR